VHPSAFPADFDGCPTAAERALDESGEPTVNTYVWTIEDLSRVKVRETGQSWA
jgi:hypothetical protein